MSSKWKEISDEEKKKYIELSEKDKQRYLNQRNELCVQQQTPEIPGIIKTRGRSVALPSSPDKQSYLYKSAVQRNVSNFCLGLLLCTVSIHAYDDL